MRVSLFFFIVLSVSVVAWDKPPSHHHHHHQHCHRHHYQTTRYIQHEWKIAAEKKRSEKNKIKTSNSLPAAWLLFKYMFEKEGGYKFGSLKTTPSISRAVGLALFIVHVHYVWQKRRAERINDKMLSDKICFAPMCVRARLCIIYIRKQKKREERKGNDVMTGSGGRHKEGGNFNIHCHCYTELRSKKQNESENKV